MRKVETKHMQLHPHAANDADTFAEIDFGMSRRMRKRNDHLSRLRARQPHVVFYDRIAARKAVFDPQPLENPLCRMPLLRRRRLICLEDRVDDRKGRPALRLFRVFGPHAAGRRRRAAHLDNRLPAQSEAPRRLPPALPLNKNKPSNRCVGLHCKHPRPPFRIKIRKGSAPKVAGFYSATQPQNAAAPWPTIAPPRTKRWQLVSNSFFSDIQNAGLTFMRSP